MGEISEIQRKISLVYTYYENPRMLERLVKHIGSFDPAVLSQIELVVVDDGSPANPAERFIGKPAFPCQVFRVTVDKPWNQSGARNIGAFECRNEWMLLLDMDMEVPYQTLASLLTMEAPVSQWYLFSSRPVDRPTDYLGRHHNAIFMPRSFYWEVGGFDENFDGYYGTAQFFGIAAEKLNSFVHLDDLWIDMVGPAVVEDANTRGLTRKASYPQRLEIWVKRFGRAVGILPRLTLSHPYIRVR